MDFSQDKRPDFYLYFTQPGEAVQLSESILRASGVEANCSSDGRLLLLWIKDEHVIRENGAFQFRKMRADSDDVALFLSQKSAGSQFGDKESPGAIFDDSERSFLAEKIVREVRVDSAFLRSFPRARPDESLIHACFRLDLIETFSPLHHSERKWQLWGDTWRYVIAPPGRKLRDYFGESVAFYVEWMKFYTHSLIVLGVFAAILWLLSALFSYPSIDRNPLVPFYSTTVVIWGFLFVKLWQRRSNDLAYEWGTLNIPISYEMLPDFHGVWRISPITGKQELYYPAWKRRIRYLMSALVTLVMLTVAFFTMICSLNLQGYVNEYTRFGDDNPFHVLFLNQYTLPGKVFDPLGPVYLTLIPPVLHSLVIFVLNQMIYRRIAEYLTECENHKTRSEFNRSLIIKRFLFDAFDSYIALFYLAFYEVDVVELRSALLGLYMTDSIRRLLLEAVIPSAMFYGRYWFDKSRSKPEISGPGKLPRTLSYKEVYADEYEEFDDYLEMVIQHGYIILFASAFPLASLLSILTNIIEIKADLFKLLFVTKRPRVQRSFGIGIWHQIITVQSWVAILTNVFIFGFSSEQMMQWFPWLFNHIYVFDQTGKSQLEQELQLGAGRYVLGFIFFLEHVFILIGLLIHFAISDITSKTRNTLLLEDFNKSRIYSENLDIEKKQN